MHHPFIDRLVAPRGLHLGIALVATVLLWPDAALAQSTIRQPGNRPQYRFEAEPHLLLGVFDPPGFGSGTGFGAGFRGSIEIVPDGFIGSINDSVAIGFGADWVHYEGNDGDARGVCTRYATGPAGVPICVEVDDDGAASDHFFFPVVLQWNFWLARKWSVFGEPGLALHWDDRDDLGIAPFVIWGGGRFHFNDSITLTLRVGYPTFSLGASFLL